MSKSSSITFYWVSRRFQCKNRRSVINSEDLVSSEELHEDSRVGCFLIMSCWMSGLDLTHFVYEIHGMQKHAAVAESQASEVPHSSQSQVHSNGATQQHASGTPHGDLLGDLIGTLAIDAPPAEPTTGPSDSQALEAPPKSPAISAASADSLALVVLDAAPTQVQVCAS